MEELLLDAAPLAARARHQKPRKQLKEDATDKDIREDELYRIIETDFQLFVSPVSGARVVNLARNM